MPSNGSKRVVFEVEVPSIYTDDLDELREFKGEFESESDWLLNCIGEPGVCRLRVEISGEKDSEVAEVWGLIRAAKLMDSSPNSEAHLADIGFKLMHDEDSCEWCDHDRNTS